MSRRNRHQQTEALVLADIPERNRVRELQEQLNNLRDAIAELDLDIETVRDELDAFESHYHARLREEHEQLRRIDAVVHQFERWAELLRNEDQRGTVVARANRVQLRRTRELEEQQRRQREQGEQGDTKVSAGIGDATYAKGTSNLTAQTARGKNDRLKAAYRALARRYHPDLARTEEERLRFSELMTRINALYRAGDLARLTAMAEQSKGGEIEENDANLQEQIATLEQRLQWFRMVLQNLRDEQGALERSPTCELWRNVQQAEKNGRDLVAEMKEELQKRVRGSYPHVKSAACLLEAEVMSFNRRQAAKVQLATTDNESKALTRTTFDPFADKRLVRLGLEQLRDLHVSADGRRMATVLEERLNGNQALLRLVLFTYVAELSPFPLPGLESYERIVARFNHLSERDEARVTLEQALVVGDVLLEFGVRRASERVAHMGLRFHAEAVREAVPLLLKSPVVRQEFRRVLGVLGDQETCTKCKRDIFAVPLFRTRGLDNLRALACPACGHFLRSYWMPKGKDVQSVLNAAFLDFELVTEWTFRLGRGSIAMQLLPLHVESMRVGDLKKRFHQDVFARNELEIENSQLIFSQGGTPLKNNRRLDDLTETQFDVGFTDEASMTEVEALEVLRHRVRARFRAD